jgi:DivIVA domain-containing protein
MDGWSVTLTPEEIERREFPGGFRGYRRVPVREFLREVGQEVATAREAAIDRPAVESERLVREAEARANQMLTQAQRHADEVVAAAQRRAAQVAAAAQHHANQLRAQAEQDAAQMTADAEAMAARLLERARSQNDELVGAARAEADTILRTTRQTAITEASAAVLRAEQRLNTLVSTEREVFDRLVAAMHALRGMAGPDVTLEAFLGPDLAPRVRDADATIDVRDAAPVSRPKQPPTAVPSSPSNQPPTAVPAPGVPGPNVPGPNVPGPSVPGPNVPGLS